jgi:hypothetical protein
VFDLIETADPPDADHDNEPYDAALSVSVAELDKSTKQRESLKLRAIMARLLTLGRRGDSNPPPQLPMYETVSSGWNAENKLWKEVLWPKLDDEFLRVKESSKPAAWKLEWSPRAILLVVIPRMPIC